MSPPHLVLPITIEPSKPRLCHDERFLNLWIRDLPFKLDHLADLPRYVLPGHFQTTFDNKSGYQHVRLHPSSETYFGLEWDYFFFVFRTLPFGWKASAYIYHNLGLVVSHAARSLGVPLSQYIDDRHVGQLFASPMRSVVLPSAQRAEAAAFILCYILIEAGYFYLRFLRQFPRLKQFHLVRWTTLLSFSFIKIRRGGQWCMSPHVPEELAPAPAVWPLAPLTQCLESSGPSLLNVVASTTLILSRILA